MPYECGGEDQSSPEWKAKEALCRGINCPCGSSSLPHKVAFFDSLTARLLIPNVEVAAESAERIFRVSPLARVHQPNSWIPQQNVVFKN